MKRIYTALNLIEAQLASDTLTSAGITNHLFNVNASAVMGEVPFTAALPEIWVEDDAQAQRATELLREASATQTMERPCPRCGEANPGNFLSCWACGCALPPA